MNRILRCVLAGGVAIVLVWIAQAQEPFKPGKLPKEEIAALKPGLMLRFYDAAGMKLLDARRSRLAALFVADGTAPTPAIPPGKFVAKLSGLFKIPLRNETYFHLFARGQATLRVNNKELLAVSDGSVQTKELVELSRGYNLVEVTLVAPEKGDAAVRVSWQGEDFALEPLPPDSLFSRGDDVDFVKGQTWRDGRLAFTQHGCAHCHELPVKNGVMPELAHESPSLVAAGNRFRGDWLAAWIKNPRDLRPKATMPALLQGDETDQMAADLTAFILSAKSEPTAFKPGDSAQGEKLYNTLGCLACHHFEDPKLDETVDRYPLFYIGAKYQPAELAKFLQAPHHNYAWSRMPDFKLKELEAAAITAYLLQESKGKAPPAKVGDAGRGKQLFTSVGCANCHKLDEKFEHKRLPAPSKLDAGCLAAAPEKRGIAPDFGFKKNKREGLTAFLKDHTDTLTRDVPAEFAQRQVANLKCQACHRRDGQTTRWIQVLEEDGTLPELLPLLTWTGEKLKPEWSTKLLKGEHSNRARPWLKARMPAFPARAELIALGLSHEHGFAADEDSAPKADPQLAELGAKLMPQIGGFNCVQCHGVGEKKAVAPFEAPGINLLDAAFRVRYSYYPRWMLDPPRVDLSTKMPKLSMDGKTTGIKEVLGGDARKQFDALWHHIQSLK